MARRHDLRLRDGRALVAYEAPIDANPTRLTLVWHHGSPHSGALLQPIVDAAAERGIRLVSYARPSYGGSSSRPGRDVATAADDVGQLADALGVGEFAVMGASGGGPHALACAALLPGRVLAAVTLASPAPFTTEFDWFAGMVSPGALAAARDGREARARHAETEAFDERSFTERDWAALGQRWASLGRDAGMAGESWPEGLIDDDVAFARSWGFDVASISVPVLIVQGGEDRVIPATHAHSLARLCSTAELWLRPRDGHVSVLEAIPLAMDWLLASVGHS